MTWLFHPAVPWVIATLTTLGWLTAAFAANLRHHDQPAPDLVRQLAEAETTIVALRFANTQWRRWARDWQTKAERAERDAHTAMLHTPFGPALEAVTALPDTRETA